MSHKQVHDELVYRVEFENDNPELSGFQDATLQYIRAASQVDPEMIVLRSLIESGWPSDKAKVPHLVRSYWHVRHELTVNEGLLFKQDRVVIPTSLHPNILYKLHAAHRGAEFTLRHARNCVFWPGLNSQITDMCKNCATCAQHAHQHPREPLQPYPVPTLPWQLVSQDLFEINGLAYLVTVDHYSDYYELDRLPNIQSSAVIQATKQHFGRHGVPHTLVTDNGAQFTSDTFKVFAKKYGFQHITSSPYWSQSNGRAEAAVKSAKHILLTAEDVDLALLSVRNTPPAGHTFSPSQRLFGRTLRSDLPQTVTTLQPRTPPCDMVVAEHTHRKSQQKSAYDKQAGPPLPELPSGSYVYAKPPPNSSAKAWIPGEIVGPAGPRSYFIWTGVSQIRRNRVQVQLAPPRNTDPIPSQLKAASNLPDKLRPKPGVAPAPAPYISPRPAADASPRSTAPNAEPESPIPVLPSSPPFSQPPAFSSQASPLIPMLSSSPASQTVTRSGRVVRRPARYSD